MRVNDDTTAAVRFSIDNSHLVDDPDFASTVTGTIQVGSQGIFILFDGYTTKHESVPADVVLVEVCPENGHPNVCVWPDINIEDPCQVINLSGAHMRKRKDLA